MAFQDWSKTFTNALDRSEFFELKEDEDLAGLKDKIRYELTVLQLESNLPVKYKPDNGTEKT